MAQFEKANSAVFVAFLHVLALYFLNITRIIARLCYVFVYLDTACGYFLQTSKKTKQNLDAYMAAISEVSRTKAAEIIQVSFQID